MILIFVFKQCFSAKSGERLTKFTNGMHATVNWVILQAMFQPAKGGGSKDERFDVVACRNGDGIDAGNQNKIMIQNQMPVGPKQPVSNNGDQ